MSVDQTILEGPIPGNGLQAAVASYFDVALEAVPHFALFGSSWSRALQMWAEERGWHAHVVTPEENDRLFKRCIVVGTSPRGRKHACVCEAGAIEWDPHPSRAGLVDRDLYIHFYDTGETQ